MLAGFECSTHRARGGRRLDLLAATGHDRLAGADYARLRAHGIRAARDGVRWHLAEPEPGRLDWSGVRPMLHAARDAGVQVVWDLCHYGVPDWLDVFSPAFPDCLARFAAAVAALVRDEGGTPLYCPVNEISFWAWAGGEVGRFGPFGLGRGDALKRQLVRAAVAATRAVRATDPRARFITAEPLIHVASGTGDPGDAAQAEHHRLAQFEACDMLCGRLAPELGGGPDVLDLVGVNFYPDNQWYLGDRTIPLGHHAHRPLSEMLREVAARYGRRLLVAETGAEGAGRAAWLHYVADEVRAAQAQGVAVDGLCLYPVLDYPGWEDDRTCRSGLWAGADDRGHRAVHAGLAEELARQQALFGGAAQGRPGALPPVAEDGDPAKGESLESTP